MHDDGRRDDVMQDIFDEMNRNSGEPITGDDDAQTIPPA
jgi:hypothetical protein